MIYCLDTQGRHFLSDAIARKLFNIVKGGYTFWKMNPGQQAIQPFHYETLEESIQSSIEMKLIRSICQHFS
jgi:hypothetical protein